MLILTRRPNQAVMIGNEVTVTILEIDGQRVRLGIAAPGDIPILRDELVGRRDLQVVSPPIPR
jgi:carbon storage regulator